MRKNHSDGKRDVDEKKGAKDEEDEEEEEDDAEATFGMSFLWEIALKALDTEVRFADGMFGKTWADEILDARIIFNSIY